MSTRDGSRPGISLAKPAVWTFRQRSADALPALRDALHLPSDMTEGDVLNTALAELVTEENRLSPNPQFADMVRQRYQELVMLRSTAASKSRKRKALEPLVPLRYAEGKIDPFAPPDPKTLMYVYGPDKLSRALHDYTLALLKQTAARIERENPGTKPTNRGVTDSVIEYIVRYTRDQ